MATVKKKTIWVISGSLAAILIAGIATPTAMSNQAKQEQKDNSTTDYYTYTNTEDEEDSHKDIADQTCLSDAARLGPTEAELDNIDLAVTNATKTIQMYDAKLKCYENTGTSIYSNTIAEIKSKKAELEQLLAGYYNISAQNYTYTETEPVTTTPTPTYTVPDYTPAPSPTPTCADYHTQYYAEYQTQLSSTNSHYTSAINSAAATCSSQHGSYGGCPQKTSLEQQWQSAVAQLKSSYKNSMTGAGCDPSEYVNF